NSSRDTNSNFKTYSNNKASRRKRCFVCEKEGCWSINYSKYEQDDAKRCQRQRINRSQKTRRKYVTESGFDEEYEEYLLFFESVNPEDEEQHSPLPSDYDDDYQAFLNDADENINTLVTYHTEFGNVTENEASLMLQQLLISSTRYAITKQKMLEIANDNQTINSNQSSFSDRYLICNHYDLNRFQGVIIDTAASQYSTARYPQYQVYIKIFGHVNINNGKTISNHPLKLSTLQHQSLTCLFSLSLNDLDQKHIYFNNVTNHIINHDNGKEIPVVRRFGHAFLRWGTMITTTVYLTETELRSLHRRFGYPSARWLDDLLRRAGYDGENHRKLLKSITKYCNNFQKHCGAPLRLRLHQEIKILILITPSMLTLCKLTKTLFYTL
ncbi:hypothetical protein GcM1_175016, partial [Golovinomyces cichoracearum]